MAAVALINDKTPRVLQTEIADYVTNIPEADFFRVMLR
jgi:hypothetical protein